MKRVVVAVLVLAAVAALLAAGTYVILANSRTGEGGCAGSCPQPAIFGLGTPVESNSTSGHSYDLTVIAAADGLRWSDLGFQILTTAGTRVVPSAVGWSLDIRSSTGGVVAVYDIGNTTTNWLSGGPTPIAVGDVVSLVTPPGTSLREDRLTALGQGTFSGSISVTLP